MSVLLQTSFGDIVIDLQYDKFPTACYNFVKLCKIKHYNNALFMKVQKDFVTQINTKKSTTIWKQLGQNKTYFNDQIDMQAKVNALGLVGTSNSGPNLNNSQFFITLTKSHLSSLNGKHTVFGKVQEGFDVLKKINQTYVDQKNRPQMNIRIMHTFILQDPFEDPKNLKQPQSPKLQKDSHRLQAIQHLQMLQKYSTQKDIIDATRKQKAKKQAMTLQMIGALPDANVKPPQNILFVCKLNPITQQRDLQVIFSRFGPIKSVEVVRDWKTGQSLQYGFIQFESQKSCEQAYLKMDNVIIDDRRIKVDFSQSVSKLMPKMKNNQVKTYNNGQNKQKGKQIVSRFRPHKQYYGDKKYDIVAKDTTKHNTRLSQKIYERRIQQRQQEQIQNQSVQQYSQKNENKQRKIKQDKDKQKQKSRSRQKKQKKKRKQQRSISSSVSIQQKQRKQKYRDDSQQKRHRKQKDKKKQKKKKQKKQKKQKYQRSQSSNSKYRSQDSRDKRYRQRSRSRSQNKKSKKKHNK